MTTEALGQGTDEQEGGVQLLDTADAVAKRTGEATFVARRQNLVLVIDPRQDQYAPGGRKIGQSQGARLEFIDGVLRVATQGNVKVAGARGAGNKKAATMPADEVMTFLETHPLVDDREDGFWRMPDTPPDLSADEQLALTQAAVLLDVEQIRAFIEAEEANWARPGVLKMARTVLATVEQTKAGVPAAGD